MSKAENPDSLVLDVKYGRASFQSTVEEAEILAKSMIATGEANGLNPTTCFLTHMDSILGSCVGNWLEVQECIQILKTGTAPCADDLIALVVVESAQMLRHMSSPDEESWEELVQRVYSTLQGGKAYRYFEKMVQAQGGDISVLDLEINPYPIVPKYSKTVTSSELLSAASSKHNISTGAGYYITEMDGMTIGELGVQLGAGRHKADDDVDPIAGMHFFVKEGDYINVSQHDLSSKPIVTVQTNLSQEVLDRVCDTLLKKAIEISSDKPNIPFCISHKVTTQHGLQAFKIPECLQKTVSK